MPRSRRKEPPKSDLARWMQLFSNVDALLLGSARRFATYKRATLLLRDRERLARLLNDPHRPVILVFAGKAHPNDQPGQALIRELYRESMSSDLIGRLIVVEGYDMHLARNLVQGCDVWLNTPEYPMEASGTSGMKAGINGALNVSILDGWWPEAWNGENGFAITPLSPHLAADIRETEEGRQLLDLLEFEVIPCYYDQAGHPYSEAWIQRSRAAMRTLIPRFTAQRMLRDYVERAYVPAVTRSARISENDAAGARALATWKESVRHRWSGVSIHLPSGCPRTLRQGQRLNFEVDVDLNGLTSEDVVVECLIGREERGGFQPHRWWKLECIRCDHDRASYQLDAEPLSGLQYMRLRAYPTHPLLSHPFEMGCMVWV